MKRFFEVIKGCKEYFQLLKKWALNIYEQQRYFEPNKETIEDKIIQDYKQMKDNKK